MEKNNFNHLAILTCMTISIVTAFIYFARIEMDLYEIIKNKHHVLVDFSGTDNAPFKYRILFPIVSEFLQIFLKLIFNEKISFQLSYIFLNTFSIFAFTTLCFFYFQKYFKNSTSIIGVLLIGILINVHLKDLFIVGTILDASFLVLALLLIKNQKYYWLFPLLVFAGLNRETSILILVIFFIKLIFLKKINKKYILLFLYLILTYLFIFISLRYFLGPAEHTASYSKDHYLLTTFYGNIKLKYFLYALFLYFMFFGFLWTYVIKGFKKLNYDLRENYLILLFYLPLIWVFGAWYETRLLIPMFSIVIPSLLAFYDNTK